jgi:uncharacterized protein with gpF-like domain
MLIGNRNRRAQFRLQRQQVRMMVAIERKFIPRFANLIFRQYSAAASKVKNGNRRVSVNFKKQMRALLESLYRTTANVFLDFVTEEINKFMKQAEPLDEFWKEMNKWIAGTSLLRNAQLNNTTKNTIRMIIRNGIEDGLTNAEISKNIMDRGIYEKTQKFRATRIVRTETHTASSKSIRTAIGVTGIAQKKQWVHAGDSRVRSKPFNHRSSEIQDFDKPYERSGLMYPGDSLGAAGDVVNCRCIEIYLPISNRENVQTF